MWNTSAVRTKVLIWLAAPLLRAGVHATLRRFDHLRIIDDVLPSSDGAHVIVTDWASGLMFARRETGPDLPSLLPHSRVLIICAQVRDYPVALALRTGVHGIVRAGCTGEELGAAVHALAEGSTYLCPDIAQRISERGPRDELTARESEVLHLLARGYCNKLIARHLGIAEGTVKTHVKGIMAKLNANSRTEAASIAAWKGLVEVPEYRSMRLTHGSRERSGARYSSIQC